MTQHSLFYFAAMASSALPQLSIAAVHPLSRSGHAHNEQDAEQPIESAVIVDTKGSEYDVYSTHDPRTARLLERRAEAAQTFLQRSNTAIFHYLIEEVVASQNGLLITKHLDGIASPFDQMNLEQLSDIGTAIGALHRTSPKFLDGTAYPSFTSQSLQANIRAWLKYLAESKDALIPQVVLSRWEQLCSVESLWDFSSTTVHGGFSSNDFLFNRNRISAVCNWESLQVSDPAHDLAWVYSGQLDDRQQDEVLAAYGRQMGSSMDSRIVPRARMWAQMEVVTDLFKALGSHNTQSIRDSRASLDALTARLTPAVSPHDDEKARPVSAQSASEKSSTITVGNLLDDSLSATEIIHHVAGQNGEDNEIPPSQQDDEDNTIESRRN